MQTATALTTVRVGNHTRSPEEIAAGAPDRLPFVDADGAPVDPDEVRLALAAPTGVVYTFAYPTVGTGDAGLVQQEAVGRFYVDWTPQGEEDGVWGWFLLGAMAPGSSMSDQDVFYTKRPLTPLG